MMIQNLMIYDFTKTSWLWMKWLVTFSYPLRYHCMFLQGWGPVPTTLHFSPGVTPDVIPPKVLQRLVPISPPMDVNLALIVAGCLLAAVARSVARALGEDALPDVGVSLHHPESRAPRRQGGGGAGREVTWCLVALLHYAGLWAPDMICQRQQERSVIRDCC